MIGPTQCMCMLHKHGAHVLACGSGSRDSDMNNEELESKQDAMDSSSDNASTMSEAGIAPLFQLSDVRPPLSLESEEAVYLAWLKGKVIARESKTSVFSMILPCQHESLTVCDHGLNMTNLLTVSQSWCHLTRTSKAFSE